MTVRIIETPEDLEYLGLYLGALKLPFTVEITPGKHRTNKQNRLQRQWMNELAEQLPEHNAEYWRGYCKLHFGVPILRAGSETFTKLYDEKVRPYPYETKMEFMQEPWDFPVTRMMNTKQKKAYLDAIQKFAAERGVVLTDPEGPMMEPSR